MSDVHAADIISADLIGLFERGAGRLQGIVQAGLQRGLDPARAGTARARVGDASLQYRARQLQQAQAILTELHAEAGRLGPATIARSYTAGLVAVDRSLTRTAHLATAPSPAFGIVHQRAVSVAAANLTDSLRAAVEHAGTNVAAVFERANRLEAGLPVDALPGGFVGRRVNDPFRGATIEQVGQGLVAGDTRRDVSAALAQRLVREGTTDALTGFVDKAGRRWPLATYASMAARTTTREVMSRAIGNRLQQNGQDLVTISSHPHAADECSDYDGVTFSLSGDTPGYDVLDTYPPFHPNCLHVVTPASDTLDKFEAELLGSAKDATTPRKASAKPAEPYTPKKGERVAFGDTVNALDGKPIKGGTASVVEVKGDRVMLNAGSAKNPKWIQTTTDKLEAFQRATPKPRAGVERIEIPKPFSKPVLRPSELRGHLAQDTKTLDTDAKKAVKEYTGDAFYDLNSALRRGRNPELAQRLDRAFAQVTPTTEPSVVYRGVDLSRIRGAGELTPGRVIEDRGFSSSSARRSVAEEFAKGGGDVLEIEVPPGARLLDVNRVAGSHYGGESELLPPRGSRFVITEVIPAKPPRARIIRARLIVDA